MTRWKLRSIPPHDFFLCLDLEDYFDHEHEPASIMETGFIRSIPLPERDILVQIQFNGEVEQPEFAIACEDDLTQEDIALANRSLARILGTELDLRPLYKSAANDEVLSPKLNEFYGLKRIVRANFFEDALNRIIKTQISHAPTARKMVYGVRAAYSAALHWKGKPYAAWPRPHQLTGANPVAMKKFGLSERKGEYVIGLAQEFTQDRLSLEQIEALHPLDLYNTLIRIRGIGPTTAQDLVMMRNRPDAVFPSRMEKGEERGLRRWIIYSYGCDPNHTEETEFQAMIRNWKNYEALALEFLYANYIMSEKRKQAQKKKKG